MQKKGEGVQIACKVAYLLNGRPQWLKLKGCGRTIQTKKTRRKEGETGTSCVQRGRASKGKGGSGGGGAFLGVRPPPPPFVCGGGGSYQLSGAPPPPPFFPKTCIRPLKGVFTGQTGILYC